MFLFCLQRQEQGERRRKSHVKDEEDDSEEEKTPRKASLKEVDGMYHKTLAKRNHKSTQINVRGFSLICVK